MSDESIYDGLQQELESSGAEKAIDRLCAALRERKDYHNLFYAMLMRKRHQLGVTPIPTLPSQQLPAEAHQPYEEAIREAAHTVGKLFLQEGNIPSAWAYYSMLGEPAPVAEALDRFAPAEDGDLDAVVNIAYHQGVNPRRGFDIILDRYGLCSAITTLGGHQFPHGPEVREYCLRRVIRTLYNELRERLRADIARVEGQPPDEATSVRDLIRGRPWLFAGDYAHIDVSHLGAVVQMSMHMAPGSEEFGLARELCEYGQRLPAPLQYASEPPFEDQYKDYGIYLAILAGDDAEEGLAHFRKKIEEADPDEIGTYPAEVFVNLLLRVGRDDEALRVASKYLVNADERQLTCPGIIELCDRTKDYRTLATLARAHDNPVHFLAGLIAAKG